MINFDGTQIKFSHMGYFNSERPWVHPKRVINTYEIIFVTEGKVFMREEDREYSLKKGDILILSPNLCHAGFKESSNVKFFWLHFFLNDQRLLTEKCYSVNDYHNYELLFRRLNHLSTIGANKSIIELELALLFLNQKAGLNKNNKLFSDVSLYIKNNIATPLTVSSLAKEFCYSADHLSKIFIKNTGISLKKYIDNERNGFVKSLLLNTRLTIKEIADQSGFIDDGAFIKFFKYNNSCSPTEFRSLYYASYINNK